jgi:hypothetical protein
LRNLKLNLRYRLVAILEKEEDWGKQREKNTATSPATPSLLPVIFLRSAGNSLA